MYLWYAYERSNSSIRTGNPCGDQYARLGSTSAHLSAAAGLVGVPCGNILGPLIIWALKRNESLGVDAHGKESLNFHLSWTLYAVASSIITTALMFVLIGFLIWPFLILALIIGWFTMVVLVIIASVKASNGELYRYPLTIRFLK